ncbi:hypothetical protein L1987_24391 [Smallanthus sonchifolius]|uniref:Uncharacterized protein n=1 Tax=Smallanthus sonchifolius TaxID=185202 RepID=A0ACB9IKC3_9ASTR|nr:hypothetical protein L1987_24391 [Smallanthus sonchifolius]
MVRPSKKIGGGGRTLVKRRRGAKTIATGATNVASQIEERSVMIGRSKKCVQVQFHSVSDGRQHLVAANAVAVCGFKCFEPERTCEKL